MHRAATRTRPRSRTYRVRQRHAVFHDGKRRCFVWQHRGVPKLPERRADLVSVFRRFFRNALGWVLRSRPVCPALLTRAQRFGWIHFNRDTNDYLVHETKL